MSPKISAFSASKSEIKDLVMAALSHDDNLTAKAIYQKIGRDFGSTITYQGVHKCLRQLEEQSILLENNRKYALNPQWVSELNTFINKVSAKKSGQASLEFGEIKDATSIILPFNSYVDALYALLDNMDRDRQANKTRDTAVAHWSHCWPLTCLSKREYDQLMRVMWSGDQYMLGNHQTYLDKVLSDFWRDTNCKIIMGIPCATHCDLVVTRDKVMQIYLSPPVKKGLDEVFQKSSPNHLDFASLYSHVFGLKGNVTVIITQNKELADQIREETLKYFK